MRTKRSESERASSAGAVARRLATALVLAATVTLCSCANAQDEDGARITGFAFVDSSVTGQGSAAQLPANAKIFPPGARITGTEGCPSSAFRTDGLIVVVIDYRGRPSAGSVTVSAVPAPQFGGRPPYYLDLDTGRTLQFLGPLPDNGTYRVKLDYFLGQAESRSTAADFTLARSCPQG
jgi:hypothetical protein